MNRQKIIARFIVIINWLQYINSISLKVIPLDWISESSCFSSLFVLEQVSTFAVLKHDVTLFSCFSGLNVLQKYLSLFKKRNFILLFVIFLIQKNKLLICIKNY